MTPLASFTLGVGLALLAHYGMASPYLFTFWGDAGWLPRDLLDMRAVLTVVGYRRRRQKEKGGDARADAPTPSTTSLCALG